MVLKDNIGKKERTKRKKNACRDRDVKDSEQGMTLSQLCSPNLCLCVPLGTFGRGQDEAAGDACDEDGDGFTFASRMLE